MRVCGIERGRGWAGDGDDGLDGIQRHGRAAEKKGCMEERERRGKERKGGPLTQHSAYGDAKPTQVRGGQGGQGEA